jgi:hypothetical protein
VSDITELLRAGAGSASGLDLAEVELRARALRRRRAALRAAAVLSVAVVAVPLGLNLREHESHGLRQLPGEGTQRPVRSPGVLADDQRSAPTATLLPTQVPTGVPSQAPSAGPGPAAPAAVPGATLPAPSPRPTGEYPTAPSCQVSTAGLEPGESRSCRFTAASAGGWVVSGVILGRPGAGYEIRVLRGGRSTRYDASCSNDGIRPGDRVTATVTQGGQETLVLQVGSGFSCAPS